MNTPAPAPEYALRRPNGMTITLVEAQGRELEKLHREGHDVLLPGERLVRRTTVSAEWEEVA